jgi:nicotinate-nucleotide pyrophosphorylase (carboxylating)
MTDVAQIVRRALDEDIGSGDITTAACVPAGRRATGTFLGRQHFVLAGTEVLPVMFDDLKLYKHDGDTVSDGEIFAEVHGSARHLLECERTALNFLQRLSGIATLARAFADQVKGTKCKVLDTRKTTPGLRVLEKRAAAAGGITNHRMGLFDAILIKNNHISAAGGVKQALDNARAASTLPVEIPVEIEVRTRAELQQALESGATRLLLDNLTPDQAEAWIQEIAGRASVEISGGVTLETVRAYALTGADFVSAGAITHSAPAVDISFRLELL